MNQQMKQEKRNLYIERTILLVYGLYTLAMMLVSYISHWPKWIPQLIAFGLIISVSFHIRKYKDYRFRAYFTAIMAWLNFLIYGFFSENLFELLSTMVCMVVLLSIYRLPQLSYIAAVASTVLLVYHACIVQSFAMGTPRENLRMFLQILSVYVIEFVTYRMVWEEINILDIMKEAIEGLEAAEQSKDDFLSNVSHEIRTPINTICGISEIILQEDLQEKVRQDVFGIQTAGRNLLTVVSDVLDFSELQSGKLEIEEEVYNFTSTINDIINMTIARMEGKDIELLVDCDTHIPCGLVGDEQKIRRVIMNIVDNAIKFTNAGGILLQASARKEEYGVNLCISVKDTGIGMDAHNLERLFSSFNQVDTKRNRQEGGIGLGLAISHAIVRKMGGFINVKSTLGKGSEVSFVIPQKVVDSRPIITLRHGRDIHIISYFDMEKYEYALIRDGYAQMIGHMARQFEVHYKQCKSLAEFKRRMDQQQYNYVFISAEEYSEDTQYFDELAMHNKIILIQERDGGHVTGNGILSIYKPFYALSIASAMNEGRVMQSMDGVHHQDKRFIAPQAHVLIVDDNLMNLRVVEGLLKPYQMKISVAVSGKEALKKVESKAYDLIFMDHMMPEMDGVETFQHIREKSGKYYQTVPIIALTANAIGGAREMFLEHGFADFIAKPIDVAVLERSLRKNLPEEKLVRIEETLSLEDWAKWVKKTDTEERETVTAEAENQFTEKAKSQVTKKQSADPLTVQGIDLELGLSYCGEREDYLEIIRLYYMSGEEKLAALQETYDQKDWENYRIHTHSVKSMSLNIGARPLSELAKELEFAAKEEKEEVILKKHDALMETYETVLEAIGQNKTICPPKEQNETLTVISREELLEEVKALKEGFSLFEQEKVQGVLQKLWHCQYNGYNLGEQLEKLKEQADTFDFIGAEETLQYLLKKWGE